MALTKQRPGGLEPDPEPEPRPLPEERFTGYVVILLDARVPVGTATDLLEHADANREQLDGLRAYLVRHRRPRSVRAVTGVDIERLVQLEELARRNDAPLPVDLSRYWRLDTRSFAGSPEIAVRELLALPGVEHAYAETIATDPTAVTPDDEMEFPRQRYLRPAPDGVGGRWAWERAGGGGEQVRFVDVEQGWDLQHADIAGRTGAPATGSNRASSRDHGTAVLDIVVGLDNGSGALGLAPLLKSVTVCSHYDGTLDQNGEVIMNVANAIAVATSRLVGDARLAAGDVLLVEVERPAEGYRPAEVDDLDFAAICLATGLDIVVVAAAGNGGRDLSDWSSANGRKLTRNTGEDSRSIVVASCNPQTETDVVNKVVTRGHRRNRNRFSNYGARVDCYAWGSDVVAADGSGGYQDDFNGTSSAAAIVAGVAVVVQGMHLAATGTHLKPGQMRDRLSGPGNTEQVPVASQQSLRIGVMPDLKVIGEKIGAAKRPEA